MAIVRDTKAVGIIRIQRLGFGTGRRSRRGIAAMGDTGVSPQTAHVMLQKDILDQTIVLAQMQTRVFGRDHAGGVLTAVLEDSEAVKEHLGDL